MDDTTDISQVIGQYGVPLRMYYGRGSLTATPYRGTNTGGPEEFACTFVAAQLSSGTVLIACDMDPTPGGMSMSMEAHSFSGVADDGWSLQAERMRQTDSLDADTITGSSCLWLVFEANVLEAQATMARQRARVTEWRYGITNYLFDGAYTRLGGRNLANAISLRLPQSATDTNGLLAVIDPVPTYRAIARRLRVLKGTEVTAEVLVQVSNDSDPRPPDDSVQALTYVLSVGAGCKVQTVYRDGYDASGRLIKTRHEARVVRPYSSQAIIPAKSGYLAVNRRYIQGGVSGYMRWSAVLPLNLVIDAYLDAKAEGDFLEARGAKLAVALEALKHEFAQRANARVPSARLDKHRFVKLEARLQECARQWFEEERLPKLLEEDMIPAGAFRDLNRAAFRDLVTSLADELDLATDVEEIRQFVESRNKLVHQGQFSCVASAAAEDRPKPPSLELIAEYLADVHLLDRIILRLLDYDGEYLRRTIEGNVHDQLVRRSQI